MRNVLPVLCLLALAGCGGGGGGSTNVPPAAAPAPLVGVFLDSPVSGLRYGSASETGHTNAAGEFLYRPGETVTFRLGDILLGSAQAQETITPLDLVGANSVDEARALGGYERLLNTLLLLQSLDRDADAENGIDLAGLDAALEDTTLDLSASHADFTGGGYRMLVNRFGRFVERRGALNHFLARLNEGFTMSLVTSQTLTREGLDEVETTFEYDEAGQLLTITSDNGSWASITYTPGGQISTITEQAVGAETGDTIVESFTYNASGRLVGQRVTRVDNVLTESTFQHDEVGNVIEHRRLSAVGVFNPFGLYYSTFHLLFGIETFTVHSFDLNQENPFNLPEIEGIGRRSIPDQVHETTTIYEYLADGRVNEIRQQGIIDSTITLNQELGCYEAESTLTNVGNLPASVFLPSLPPFSAGPGSINFCGSDQQVLHDADGQVSEIRVSDTVTVTFEYQAGLLVVQESRRALLDGSTSISRTESDFDDFGNLIGVRRFLNGTLQASLSREYERRLLPAVPASSSL